MEVADNEIKWATKRDSTRADSLTKATTPNKKRLCELDWSSWSVLFCWIDLTGALYSSTVVGRREREKKEGRWELCFVCCVDTNFRRNLHRDLSKGAFRGEGSFHSRSRCSSSTEEERAESRKQKERHWRWRIIGRVTWPILSNYRRRRAQHSWPLFVPTRVFLAQPQIKSSSS